MYGYDYPTGGAGMVFTAPVVAKMVESGLCECQSADAPDDMHLGACLGHLGLSLLHNPGFHQARPEDYNKKLLTYHKPVSFHKFWNTTPRQTYQAFFADSDRHLRELKQHATQRHTEL